MVNTFDLYIVFIFRPQCFVTDCSTILKYSRKENIEQHLATCVVKDRQWKKIYEASSTVNTIGSLSQNGNRHVEII